MAELVLPGLLLKQQTIAADLLEHWLSNTVSPAIISPDEMMVDLPWFRALVGKWIAVGYRSEKSGQGFNSGWISDSIAHHFRSLGGSTDAAMDWYYALNGFQYRVRGDVRMVDGTLGGQVTLDVYKRYNWGDPYGGKRKILRGPFGIPTINQNDLAGLNSAGLAQDFDVFGSNTFQLSPG